MSGSRNIQTNGNERVHTGTMMMTMTRSTTLLPAPRMMMILGAACYCCPPSVWFGLVGSKGRSLLALLSRHRHHHHRLGLSQIRNIPTIILFLWPTVECTPLFSKFQLLYRSVQVWGINCHQHYLPFTCVQFLYYLTNKSLHKKINGC